MDRADAWVAGSIRSALPGLAAVRGAAATGHPACASRRPPGRPGPGRAVRRRRRRPGPRPPRAIDPWPGHVPGAEHVVVVEGLGQGLPGVLALEQEERGGHRVRVDAGVVTDSSAKVERSGCRGPGWGSSRTARLTCCPARARRPPRPDWCGGSARRSSGCSTDLPLCLSRSPADFPHFPKAARAKEGGPQRPRAQQEPDQPGRQRWPWWRWRADDLERRLGQGRGGRGGQLHAVAPGLEAGRHRSLGGDASVVSDGDIGGQRGSA